MTYAPHVLIAFGGRLFETEEWSCSLRMVLQTGTVGEYPRLRTWAQDNVEDIASDIALWFGLADSRISSAARLDYVKCNPIGPDGRYFFEEETIEVRYTAAESIPGAVTPGPAQDSVVVSLLTDAQRGRAHRGRFYPPTGYIAPNAATGRLSSSDTTTMAESAATLINNLNDQPGLDLEDPTIVIASSLGTPGPVRPVTRVAVGNVVDTQRRRRKSLPEAYATVELA